MIGLLYFRPNLSVYALVILSTSQTLPNVFTMRNNVIILVTNVWYGSLMHVFLFTCITGVHVIFHSYFTYIDVDSML